MYHKNSAEGKGSRVIRSTTQTVQKAGVGVLYVPHKQCRRQQYGYHVYHTQCRRQGWGLGYHMYHTHTVQKARVRV